MTRIVLLPALFLLPLLLGSCDSFGNKKPDFTITFHAGATNEDMPKSKFPFDLNGRRMFFKIVPEFSQQNIVAFYSFPAEGKKGNGITLQLDFRGTSALEVISRQRKDEYMLAMVNAKPVDFVVLDQAVTDGRITIWQGVPDDVIKKLEKKYPRIRKGGAAPNASDSIDMLPTTKGEKERAYKEGQDEERALKDPKWKEPKVPSLDLPNGPVSPKIPVEGGGTPPSAPVPPVPPAPSPLPPQPPAPGEPPLPK